MKNTNKILTIALFTTLTIQIQYASWDPDDSSAAMLNKKEEVTTGNTPGDAGPAAPNTTIDLSDSGLKDIPGYVFSNTGTEELILSGNKISDIPADIRMLTSLRILDLSNTDVTGLPEELHNLIHLQEIYLPYNNFVFSQELVRKLTRARIILK